MSGDLYRWMDAPSDTRGLRFADGNDGWTFHSYADLARAAGGAAEQIEAARSERGRPVVLVLPTRASFVTAFFGALLAGDTPCPLPPPGPVQRHVEYDQHLSGILKVAEPSLIVTDESLEEVVAQAAAHADLDIPRLCLQPHAADPTPRPPAELALLQFTSGSSGRPRGVRVSPANLETNIAMGARWTGLQKDDHWSSWLPLFHDMGLIGFLLIPIVTGVDLWLMRPDQFVRSPARWLKTFSRGGAKVGASPPFGLSFARRHVDPEELEGCDFSDWRVLVTAAERLDASTVAAFAEWLEPWGFRPETLRPAYGLAENTLAVTGTPLGTMPPVVEIEPDRLRFGEPVEVVGEHLLDSVDEIGRGAGWLVGSGVPHDGIGVEIRDDDGTLLPDGHLGEIHVTGPCVAGGYTGDAHLGTTRFGDDVLRTGDAGFVIDEELYVIGRMGDSVKVLGRHVYMEDLEAELRAVPGIPTKGRLVVIAGAGEAGDVVAAVVEAPDGDWVDGVADALRRGTFGTFTVRVFTADRGTIIRTSSGKPRRRPMWLALTQGDLDVELAAEVRPTESTAGGKVGAT